MSFPCKVIAFGISAGGLPPLRAILKMLPGDLNAAIVIVPHLSTDYRSHLDVILENAVVRPVLRIEQGMHMVCGSIYVLPEGQMLGVRDGTFTLSPRPKTEKINQAIDHFFHAMATDIGPQCIGVILSGAGYDGISGAKAIEDQKGVVIVQDPATAEFPLMPQGLIAFNHPDYILTPEEIVDKLITIASVNSLRNQ
jgi:two-component system CheB/CheR fusion protein